jgi:hypothetical protein
MGVGGDAVRATIRPNDSAADDDLGLAAAADAFRLLVHRNGVVAIGISGAWDRWSGWTAG